VEQQVRLEASRTFPFILPRQAIEVIIASIHRYSGEAITNLNGNDLIIIWVSNFMVPNSSGNPKAIQEVSTEPSGLSLQRINIGNVIRSTRK
jgi:hypothetical protein